MPLNFHENNLKESLDNLFETSKKMTKEMSESPQLKFLVKNGIAIIPMKDLQVLNTWYKIWLADKNNLSDNDFLFSEEIQR